MKLSLVIGSFLLLVATSFGSTHQENDGNTTSENDPAPTQDLLMHGHWPASSLRGENGSLEFRVNDFRFLVSDIKISRFLICASQRYPSYELFLQGIDGVASGTPIVTTAFVCRGEIDLSQCRESDRVWFCQ